MRRVLLVDDDRDYAESLRDLLEARGYLVHLAFDGQGAFDLIREHEVDCTLVDLRLGAESGVDVMGSLRAMRPGLLCIVITAHATLDAAMTAIRRGAWDHLRKPFGPEELFAAMDRAFEHLRIQREHRRAELRLRRKHARLQLLNSTLLRMIAASSGASRPQTRAAGIAAIDEAGRLSFVNASFREALGLDGAPALGAPFRGLVASSSQDAFTSLLDALRQGNPSAPRLCFSSERGGSRWLCLKAAPILDRAQGYRGACLVLEEGGVEGEQAFDQDLFALGDLPEWAGPPVSDPVEGARGQARRSSMARLSRREFEVYEEALEGGRADQIAERIGIRPNTVRNHLRQIYRKLGVHSRAELSAWAHGQGKAGHRRSGGAEGGGDHA